MLFRSLPLADALRQKRVKGHGGTAGFGLGFTDSALRPRASYVDASSREVYIGPLKSQALADAEPGTSCKQHQETFHQREVLLDRKGLLRGDGYGVVVASGAASNRDHRIVLLS